MKNEPSVKSDPDDLDGWDAETDGIDPAHYEQPPRLTPEDDAILDRVWAKIRAERQGRPPSGDEPTKTRKSGWPYEPKKGAAEGESG